MTKHAYVSSPGSNKWRPPMSRRTKEDVNRDMVTMGIMLQNLISDYKSGHHKLTDAQIFHVLDGATAQFVDKVMKETE